MSRAAVDAARVSLPGLLADATSTLAGAGVPSPRSDTEQLAAHVLAVSRGGLATMLAAGATVRAGDADRLRGALARRAAREPLQHIVGTTGFRHLVLEVGPGVFVPRPETEVVAGWAVDWLRAYGTGRPAHVDPAHVDPAHVDPAHVDPAHVDPAHVDPLCVDLCTGSGAIALAVAQEVPTARVHGVEADAAALAWARRNARATGLEVALHQATVRRDDPLGALGELSALAGRVDLVVANPPYLHDGDRGRLEPEVRDHDPPRALWGGPDGLDGLRAVAATAAALLAPGGVLVAEHDDADGEAAPALLAAAGGWERIADHDDLAGRPRFVTAVAAARPHPGRVPTDRRSR